MHSSKTLERRAFLVSSTALMTNITACTGKNGSTSADPDSSSGPESTTGGTTEATSSHANATSTTQPTATATSTTTTSPSSAGASSQSTSEATSSNSQTSNTSDGSSGSGSSSSEAEPPAEDACFEGGGTDGGMSQDAGGGVLCSTNTDNGNHCHPLVVPQSDVDAGFAEATYQLEDGGTGHTHTVTLTAYDVLYLQAGLAHEVVSTTDTGHNHVCLVTCTV